MLPAPDRGLGYIPLLHLHPDSFSARPHLPMTHEPRRNPVHPRTFAVPLPQIQPQIARRLDSADIMPRLSRIPAGWDIAGVIGENIRLSLG